MRVTPSEREWMLLFARGLNARNDPGLNWDRPPENGHEPRPGDDYNARASWPDVLEPHGWKVARQSGHVTFWARPGKDDGWSATTGHCKSMAGELLYVFTTSAPPFESEKSYSKFGAYALLNHAGDYKAAARALAGKGYGARPHHGNGKATNSVPATPATSEPRKEITIADVATIDDLAKAGAKVSWLWPGWIQSGSLTALAAEGGIGKTRFCADLIRRMRYGLPWPDGTTMTAEPDALVLWVVADNHHDEMVTLARDFDIAPAVRINALKSDPFGGVSLETHDDYMAFEAILAAVKPAFFVVDTVGNATDKNLCKQDEAKAFYQPLQVMARRHRAAGLCLTHLNADGKFLGRRILEKVRMAICISKPEPDNDKRRIEVMKSNARKPQALGLTMGDGGNEYDDQPPTRPEGFEPGQESGRDATKVKAAIDWLREHLCGAPKRVSKVRDKAEKAGISVPVLYRAVRALDVETFEAENFKWWRLTIKTPFE